MPPRNEQERTEPATPRRRQEARKKGQVARSKELPTAMVLISGMAFLALVGNWMVGNLLQLWSGLLILSCQINVTAQEFIYLVNTLVWKIAILIGPMILCLGLMAFASNVMQTGLLFSNEAMTLKFSKINPLTGMQRIVSLKSLVEVIKSFLKLAIIGYVAWYTVDAEWANIMAIGGSSPRGIAAQMAAVILRIGLRTAIALVILAVLDYLYQRWEHERSLRMTKQEVKDEFKQREGDPKVKGRIRQKQREMARKRMMAAVPHADVVITNPQHLAVAIRYDRDRMAAPEVVAKGSGFLAERIREIAQHSEVPILEDKPLAQALYRHVEVGEQIPVMLYRAVAEILAHIYRQRGKQETS
jgi:flagellar biosynthetic protein FlhB